MKITIEIPNDLKLIPEEDLKVIKKYSKDSRWIEFLNWAQRVKHLAENGINQTFITRD